MADDNDKQIPRDLLVFDEATWLAQVEDTCHFPALRARELWRREQDAWACQRGIWRAEFEQLQRQQRADQQG